jgi:hypothetical protein
MDRKTMSFEEFSELLLARVLRLWDVDETERSDSLRMAWDLVHRDLPWDVVLSALNARLNHGAQAVGSGPAFVLPGPRDLAPPRADGPTRRRSGKSEGATVEGRSSSHDATSDSPPPSESPDDAEGLERRGISRSSQADASVVSAGAVTKESTAGRPPEAESTIGSLRAHPARTAERWPARGSGVPAIEPALDPRDLAAGPHPPIPHENYERDRLSANTRHALRLARHARRWHEIRKMRNVLMNIDQGHLQRILGSESEILSQEINALLRSWAPLVRDRQHGKLTRRRR